MSCWRDQLEDAYRDQNGWERQVFIVPDKIEPSIPSIEVRVKYVDLEVGLMPSKVVAAMINTANSNPIGAIPSGNAMLCEYATDMGTELTDTRTASRAVFALREYPWNEFIYADGQWKILKDASGQPVYQSSDFSVIP